MENKKEIRAFSFEVRAEDDEQNGKHLTGRAIVFNQKTDLGYCFEVIEPTALEKTDLRDVRFLVNHNTDMIPLARSRRNNANSTMQLEVVPAEGLDIRVNLDTENNTDARALYSATERGDISGMSFMMIVRGARWEDLDTDKPTRYVTDIEVVFEVSAVTFPAYSATKLSARGLSDAVDTVREAMEIAKNERRAAEAEIERKKKIIKIFMEAHK